MNFVKFTSFFKVHECFLKSQILNSWIILNYRKNWIREQFIIHGHVSNFWISFQIYEHVSNILDLHSIDPTRLLPSFLGPFWVVWCQVADQPTARGSARLGDGGGGGGRTLSSSMHSVIDPLGGEKMYKHTIKTVVATDYSNLGE